ncbi:MAG: DUF6326 family protein [Actinomycetota bacterium]|nr:DUF6326 family protein [Acidimicrobiia bacterium]MDH5279057.1 DUF6326 family protein [Actinomycetota bacterium]
MPGVRVGNKAPASAGVLDPARVNVRHKLAALWASMLFVFVYVDLFTVYRADFRADLDAGKVNGFTVDQMFLLAVTAFVVVPSAMVFLTLVLPAHVARVANVVLSGVYALVIIGGAVGEWNYYVVGSIVEVAQLAAVGFYAWTWPRQHDDGLEQVTNGTRDPAETTAG